MKAVTWIGVDIAKESCVAAQRCPDGFQTKEFPIAPQGLKALGSSVPQEPQLQIALEATGPYWLGLHQWVQRAGTRDPDRRGEPPTGERFCQSLPSCQQDRSAGCPGPGSLCRDLPTRRLGSFRSSGRSPAAGLDPTRFTAHSAKGPGARSKGKSCCRSRHPEVRAALLATTPPAPGQGPSSFAGPKPE